MSKPPIIVQDSCLSTLSFSTDSTSETILQSGELTSAAGAPNSNLLTFSLSGQSLSPAPPGALFVTGSQPVKSTPNSASPVPEAPNLESATTKTETQQSGFGGLFGSIPTATTASSGGLFGSTPTATTASSGGLFGSTPTATTASWGGLFGSTPTATTASSGGLFGSTPTATTASSGGLFGSTPAATSASGGSVFDGSTTRRRSGFGFGASQPSDEGGGFPAPAPVPNVNLIGNDGAKGFGTWSSSPGQSVASTGFGVTQQTLQSGFEGLPVFGGPPVFVGSRSVGLAPVFGGASTFGGPADGGGHVGSSQATNAGFAGWFWQPKFWR